MAQFNQQTQRIEVIVRRAGGGTGEIEQPAGAGTTENPEAAASAPKSTEKKGRWSKNALTHYGNMVRQTGTRVLKYYLISGVKYKTGDAALQDMVDRQVEVATDYTNLAAQTFYGGFYGARFGGLIGAGVGATFSFTSAMSNLLLERGEAERDYNMKLFKEENGIAYRRARAGINLTTGRLR